MSYNSAEALLQSHPEFRNMTYNTLYVDSSGYNEEKIQGSGLYVCKIVSATISVIKCEPVLCLKFMTSDNLVYDSLYWLRVSVLYKIKLLMKSMGLSDDFSIRKERELDVPYLIDYILDFCNHNLVGRMCQISLVIDKWFLDNRNKSVLVIDSISPFTSTAKVDLLSEPELISTDHQRIDIDVFSEDDIPF